MDITQDGFFSLTELSKINILLGKNGCGKSTLLKRVEDFLTSQNKGQVNYVTPERGGSLTFNSSVEQSVYSQQDYERSLKRNNQWGQFKNFSVTQYRQLEILSLREIEQDRDLRGDFSYTFESIIEKINSLLTNVKIVRTVKSDFEIFLIATDKKVEPYMISSGESELISLAIECLKFEKSCNPEGFNFLLLDEPDVHLHPDLQANFVMFLLELLKSNKFSIIIATHSTAILGALLNYQNSRFAILTNGSTSASFMPITQMYQNILPIFGAHPLSNLFNQSPILLVEGEDDVRIFQQAIRSSNGRLRIYPCSVDGVGNLPEYESSVSEIINGVYDNAKAYSLRDKDEGDENIEDSPPLIRFKTSCRNIENLILCDELLFTLGSSWEIIQEGIEKWLTVFTTHSKYNTMEAFKLSGYDRKEFDLKEIRNILIGLSNSNKPWEIAVGQTISKLVTGHISKDFTSHKLCNFLGRKLSEFLAI